MAIPNMNNSQCARRSSSNRQSEFRNPQSIVFLLFLATLLLPSTLFAQYTIYGGVKLPEGGPASRVTVNISGQTGLSRQAFSDDMGRYEFPSIPRGRYHLTAINPSDPDQFTDPVEIDLSRNMGSRILVNLFLRNKVKVVMPKESKAGVISLAEEAQRVPKNAQKAFSQALALRSAHKYDQSLKSFGNAVEAFPDYFQALAERGHLLIAMNQPDEAAKDFARSLEINPRYGPGLRGAGICEFQQGKYEGAIEHLSQAANAEPANATTHLFLGVAALALDRREQARANLHKALRIDAVGAARAHVHLANLWIKENKPLEALTELEAYLAAAPNAPDAEKLRAIAAQLQAESKQH